MATYTVRPEEKEVKTVDLLKEFYNESAASKALLRAAADVPKLSKEVVELKRERDEAFKIINQYRTSIQAIAKSRETLAKLEKDLDKKECEEFRTGDIQYIL